MFLNYILSRRLLVIVAFAAICLPTFSQTHLDIMAPDLKDSDLSGPVKSVDTKVSINVSGKFEREYQEYDPVGNLLSETEWDPDGEFISTQTNFYSNSGNFERQVYIDYEEAQTNNWSIILNPDTHQIAMREEETGSAAVYTYSPAGYLLNYRYVDGDKKLVVAFSIKRDEQNRRKEYTLIDDSRKPLYTYWFKWKDNEVIDRERQRYRQEKGERLHIYDYLETDDHGNWTQQLMVRYDIGGDEKVKVFERLVVRTIEYFETDDMDSTAELSSSAESEEIAIPHMNSGGSAAKIGRSQAELKAEFNYAFDSISDKLVIISCKSEAGRSAGSGFVAKMNGRTYLLTNQHVIMGADTIRLKTADGETLTPRSIELSKCRDIARILIDDRDGFEISKKFAMGIPLGVFGNSEGAGVATELFGEVTGVGADLVEVNAEFVSGNSGSPVLDTDQKVIGIASYVQVTRLPSEDDEEDEEGGGSPKTETRRFCYRLTGVEWQPVKWNAYNEKYGKLYHTSETVTKDVFEILSLWADSPSAKLPLNDDMPSDLAAWVKRNNNRGYSSASAYAEHLEALSKICSSRSRRIRMFSSQRELTEFLRTEFERNAYALEYVGDVIQAVADDI